MRGQFDPHHNDWNFDQARLCSAQKEGATFRTTLLVALGWVTTLELLWLKALHLAQVCFIP